MGNNEEQQKREDNLDAPRTKTPGTTERLQKLAEGHAVTKLVASGGRGQGGSGGTKQRRGAGRRGETEGKLHPQEQHHEPKGP